MKAASTSSAETARLEFGRFLVAMRERQGLSRDDVVRLTKVPALVVGAMEDGEHEKWPERVFVVNALKAYAGAVGVVPSELVSRFDALPDAPKVDAFDPVALERARRARATTAALVIAALVSVVGLGAALRSGWAFVQRVSWGAP